MICLTCNTFTQWISYHNQLLVDVLSQTFLSGGYTGPVLTAKYAGETWPENQRSKVRILDVGAGTGLGAVEVAFVVVILNLCDTFDYFFPANISDDFI